MCINCLDGFGTAVCRIVLVGLFTADIECGNNRVVALNQIDYLKDIHILAGQVFGQRIDIILYFKAQGLCPCTSAGADEKYRRLHDRCCNTNRLTDYLLIRQISEINRLRFLYGFLVDFRQGIDFNVIELVELSDTHHHRSCNVQCIVAQIILPEFQKSAFDFPVLPFYSLVFLVFRFP